MSVLFEAENLTLHYDKQPVLWDLSLKVMPGRLVGIVGPNGAGKSSLLKSALGIVKPISGRALFWGKPAHLVREKIAYIPQKGSIDWDFPITAFEVVLMGRYGKMGFFKRPRRADILAAKEALEKVGMSAYADRQISQLSGGQQQRLFLARALAQNAEVYLMDEPFQCVDITTEKAMIKLLRELKSSGKSIFIVHHDVTTLRDYFDEVILLNTSLIAHGPVEDVLTEENMERTYQKSHCLFVEAKELSTKKTKGLI